MFREGKAKYRAAIKAGNFVTAPNRLPKYDLIFAEDVIMSAQKTEERKLDD